METKIYGASDDLIEFDGEVSGEVGCYGTDNRENGVLVMCSDGTVLDVKYGKGGMGVWGILVIHRGPLFDHIDHCSNEDTSPHSDVVCMKQGLKWIYAATEWELVQ